MPKTLLLADDSVTIQKVVGISFANEDVVLVTVDNGDDAIARAREARPDIVLADVVMPGMNGYEVCEAIKSDPELRQIPVLLLTGTFEAFDAERAARAGADGHITKPFEAQALVDQVNSRLAHSAASAAAPAARPQTAPTPSEAPSFEDSLGLHAAPAASPGSGEAFDFFDEEITEPRSPASTSPSSEAMDVDDSLAVGDGDDAFAFEAEGELGDELGTAPSSSQPLAASEDDWMAPDPLADAELAPDRTVAILPESDAFASAPTEPPTAPPTFGEADLTQLATAGSDRDAAATPVGDHSSSLPERPVPTRIMEETKAAEAEEAASSETDSRGHDETMILSDFEPDPIGGPSLTEEFASADTHPGRDLSAESLDQIEPDDLAAEAVLDPVSGRDFDVSSSDLGDPLQGGPADLASPEPELSSPWPVEASAGDGEEALAEPIYEADFEESPGTPETPARDRATPIAVGSPPDLSPLQRQQLHDALEKIAWEAFSEVAEQIVKDAIERIERVAWEVVPQMAEALIQEEIRKLKGEDG
jgi:CheY-like chemotaxis protein